MIEINIFKVNVKIYYEDNSCVLSIIKKYNIVSKDDLNARLMAVDILNQEFLKRGRDLNKLKIEYCETYFLTSAFFISE
jgi:hypothetical protein